ncbi:uncharacterized protein LOC143251765 [Tachypleus tridentatus]|uniref:uncharacterized protein LOC143251765 n=1 Tax=Tachypleus tridentatus TaxID=6853 RepID=UPI003FD5CC26
MKVQEVYNEQRFWIRKARKPSDTVSSRGSDLEVEIAPLRYRTTMVEAGTRTSKVRIDMDLTWITHQETLESSIGHLTMWAKPVSIVVGGHKGSLIHTLVAPTQIFFTLREPTSAPETEGTAQRFLRSTT